MIRWIPDALEGTPRVREKLTWIDTLGTEHCLIDCDCIVCESYRDGTLDWSKAPRRRREL